MSESSSNIFAFVPEMQEKFFNHIGFNSNFQKNVRNHNIDYTSIAFNSFLQNDDNFFNSNSYLSKKSKHIFSVSKRDQTNKKKPNKKIKLGIFGIYLNKYKENEYYYRRENKGKSQEQEKQLFRIIPVIQGKIFNFIPPFLNANIENKDDVGHFNHLRITDTFIRSSSMDLHEKLISSDIEKIFLQIGELTSDKATKENLKVLEKIKIFSGEEKAKKILKFNFQNIIDIFMEKYFTDKNIEELVKDLILPGTYEDYLNNLKKNRYKREEKYKIKSLSIVQAILKNKKNGKPYYANYFSRIVKECYEQYFKFPRKEEINTIFKNIINENKGE